MWDWGFHEGCDSVCSFCGLLYRVMWYAVTVGRNVLKYTRHSCVITQNRIRICWFLRLIFVSEWSGIEWVSPNDCYELHEICEIPAYSELESNWLCLQRCIRIKVLCVWVFFMWNIYWKRSGVVNLKLWIDLKYGIQFLLYSCICALVLQESSSLKCFWLNCAHNVDRGHRWYMTCSSHLPRFARPNNVWWTVQIMKLPIMQFSHLCS